jgi:hypothetical protein
MRMTTCPRAPTHTVQCSTVQSTALRPLTLPLTGRALDLRADLDSGVDTTGRPENP